MKSAIGKGTRFRVTIPAAEEFYESKNLTIKQAIPAADKISQVENKKR